MGEKILKKIYDGKKTKDWRERRTNKQLYKLFNVLNI